MFRVPFEQALSPIVFEEIDEVQERKRFPEFRVVAKSQEQLFLEGLETSDEDEVHITVGREGIPSSKATYAGDKWGGKYLRAPDIFYTILEKGKDKLVSLGTISTFAGYIHDNNVGHNYPKTRVILSSQFINKICVDKDYPSVVLEGIKKQGNSRLIPDLVVPRTYNDTFLVIWNVDGILFKRFYKICLNTKEHLDRVCLFLNSTYMVLFWEYIGVSEGLGALNVYKDDFNKLLIPKPNALELQMKEFKSLFKREIHNIFVECGINNNLPIRSQQPNPLPDRKALDDVVFDALGLTEAERKEVYWAVCELVQNRLRKARSV
jgi:hypothetical protein